ncbi:uncharacterized protein LOC125667657 [Ostrea edulis]|uniref:uncharacterized protein LOC125667657 n=1 Tax=Ostrea edulis TaxID=37623 RepID=UPI0024AECE41|nr:uncharacterized protein LOC125667657 [Ostrea edulis]XP_048757202.2 uncharacterized protein LOC125667657 [Ostrea edulis]
MSGYSGERDEDTGQSSPFPPYQTPYPGILDRSFGDSDPFFFLLKFATSNLFPRQKQQQQKEDMGDKDEFDNGYSAKSRKITENQSCERIQPISQLMEKTSKHYKKPLDGIWCKQQENIKDEEEEIRNIFQDDEVDDAELEVDGEYRYPDYFGVRKTDECQLSPAETIIKYLTNQRNNSKATITNERKKDIKCDKEEPILEPVNNTLNNLPSELSSPARTLSQISSNTNPARIQSQISSNLNDYHRKERTLDKYMNETQESMLNSNLEPKGQNQEKTDPDPVIELAKDESNGESVGQDSTGSNSSRKTCNSLSSQDTDGANESENSSSDDFDDIDEMLYDEDEMYMDGGNYTVNDMLPTIPQSDKKAHDTKGLGENAGRYSKCSISLDSFLHWDISVDEF